MKLLAIDTSTIACSVALCIDGEAMERYELAPQRHADLVLPMAESLLSESGLALAELDAIAFARGPGAFTGLRIAAAVTQGMAYGADLPVIPVSTLAVLAQGVISDGLADRVLAAMDARMGEVYWGAFVAGADGLAGVAGEECVCPPDRVPAVEGGGWFAAGDGWAAYRAVLETRLQVDLVGCDEQRYPRARDVARLARAIHQRGGARPAAEALPVYLRDRVASKPAPRR
ncbi:MAG: tRNA (adenosine(37)-N6)-threonylcarbamoyltransferase complex dimerization subunit type 1 TsaB [Gammaproteobacteria bacterium]|nr:tRNA (adenosine(37)-N6)-threonylcarbamoyltransferase complex dimerization subunit type 1 TsaB [Gammaproteobacteria bacterium]